MLTYELYKNKMPRLQDTVLNDRFEQKEGARKGHPYLKMHPQY